MLGFDGDIWSSIIHKLIDFMCVKDYGLKNILQLLTDSARLSFNLRSARLSFNLRELDQISKNLSKIFYSLPLLSSDKNCRCFNCS